MPVPISEQKPEERIKNFSEVCLGYNAKEAIEEGKRCLQCKNPQCVKGCPVSIDIPAFIKKITENKPDESLEIIKQSSNLPGVCGRVCPQETQCEEKCILKHKKDPVSIGKLERFAADFGNLRKLKSITQIKYNGKKVAIIGSGPASLTCATDLNRQGYKVTIFEALHVNGGVMTYGIPEFRLPKRIVNEEISNIKAEGVEIKNNYVIGRTLTLDELRKDFDAIFIGTGAGLPYFLNIPGEDLINVYSANEFLTRVNLMKGYEFPKYDTPVKKAKKCVVIGAGNVAMDAARTAKRLGSDVTLVYRRTIQEAPARIEEIHHAEEEGINFLWLTSPLKIIGEKLVQGIEVIKMELGEPDSSGRRRPVPVKGSEFKIDCDQVIIAIGQGPNPLLVASSNLKQIDEGKLQTNEFLQTSDPKIFAGGDIVEGDATVIKAMGDGKKASIGIHEFLSKNIDSFKKQ